MASGWLMQTLAGEWADRETTSTCLYSALLTFLRFALFVVVVACGLQRYHARSVSQVDIFSSCADCYLADRFIGFVAANKRQGPTDNCTGRKISWVRTQQLIDSRKKQQIAALWFPCDSHKNIPLRKSTHFEGAPKIAVHKCNVRLNFRKSLLFDSP